MKDVIIYTDGACSGNPGPGGWGCILFYTDSEANEHKLEMSGGEPDTTNNRMELTAVIEGIKKLSRHAILRYTPTVNMYATLSTRAGLQAGRKKAGLTRAKSL